MTRASGLITLAALCLFGYVNLGLWEAVATGIVGLILLFFFYKRLKRDPQETEE